MLILRQKTYLSFQLLFLAWPAYTSFNFNQGPSMVNILLMSLVLLGLSSFINLLSRVTIARIYETLRLFISFLILISISNFLRFNFYHQAFLFIDMLITIYLFNKVFNKKKYPLKVSSYE